MTRLSSKKGDQKGVILFNPVGSVHIRNLKILQRALPDFHFRALLRPCMPWFATHSKRQSFGVDYHTVVEGGPFDDRVFAGNVRAVILSIAMPDIWVIDMAERAHNRSIPLIAIEEVHQLTFNYGAINNYILPVDNLLVASPYEKEQFIKRGQPQNRVDDVGWPFYSGLARTGGFSSAIALRRQVCKEDQKVATLVLACLDDFDPSSKETTSVRETLMSLAHKGLPENFQLVIKGHPNEPVESIKKFAGAFAPGSFVLGQDQEIHPVLSMTDVLLTRGNTQVAIEALVRSIPVCVIPVGMKTIFHQDYPEAICNTFESLLRRVLDHASHNLFRETFLKKHLPISPETALYACSKRISQIANSQKTDIRQQKLAELTLFRNFVGFQKERDQKNILSDESLDLSERTALFRLLRFEATIEDMERLNERFKGKSTAPFIGAFWIRQIQENSDLIRCTIEKNLLLDFPPRENAFLFKNAMATWLGALCSLKSEPLFREYFDKHRESWALFPSFHQEFTKVGMT